MLGFIATVRRRDAMDAERIVEAGTELTTTVTDACVDERAVDEEACTTYMYVPGVRARYGSTK